MNMREVSMQDVVTFLNHGHLSNDKFEFAAKDPDPPRFEIAIQGD
jgi:hypothetical protein